MAGTRSSCEAALVALPPEMLVAVSGGVDSVALLEALVRTGRRPVVLHFNHGWRAESAREAKAVATAARAHGLRILLGRARAGKRNEATARAQRYDFFERSARKLGLFDLVLAHHADDQVETFLLQLLRGAGAGARGMMRQTERGGLTLHRPWLGVWKKEIMAYARARGLVWSEDPSNADPRHLRNVVRRRLLPYLKRMGGPATSQKLWRTAEIARAESEWLDTLCEAAAAPTELPVRELREAPLAQQRRTILRWLQARGVADIAFADVENVRGLLHPAGPARINLSRGKFARRRAGRIFIA
jgi:tRNA(Ile)-lysidine synthase